jgi:hypothetical protein
VKLRETGIEPFAIVRVDRWKWMYVLPATTGKQGAPPRMKSCTEKVSVLKSVQKMNRRYHAVKIVSARITLARTDIPALLRAFNNLGSSLLELFTNLFNSRNDLGFLVA